MKIKFLITSPYEVNGPITKEIEFDEDKMYEVIGKELNQNEEDIIMDIMPAPLHSVVSFTYLGHTKDKYTSDDINFLMFDSIPCFDKAAFAYLEFDENKEANLVDISDELAEAVHEYIKTNRENISDEIKEKIDDSIESGHLDELIDYLNEDNKEKEINGYGDEDHE